MCEIISKSEKETKKIAYEFAKTLSKGDIIILSRRFRSTEKLNLQKVYYPIGIWKMKFPARHLQL